MRISESKFRQILREESRKILKEQFGAVGDIASTALGSLDPRTAPSKVKDPGISGVASAAQAALVTGFDPASQKILVRNLQDYLRKNALSTGVSLGAGEFVGLTGGTGTVGGAIRLGGAALDAGKDFLGIARAGSTAGTQAIAAAGGGVQGLALGVLAPAVLGYFGVKWGTEIVIEGWIAYHDGRQAAVKNAWTTARDEMVAIYTAIANRGVQNKLWTKEQLRSANAGLAVQKFANGQSLTNEELATVVLMFSGMEQYDFSAAIVRGRKQAPAVDGNMFVAPMQASAMSLFNEAFEERMKQYGEKIKQFQAAAKTAADEIKQKESQLALQKVASDKEYRQSELQKIGDRVEFEQGRVPSSYKPVPVGTAAARASKSTAIPAKKPGS